MSLSTLITNFVTQAIRMGWLDPLDEIYTRNQLLSLVGASDYDETVIPSEPLPELLTSMDQLRYYAQTNGIIGREHYQVEQFEAAVMDLIVPAPSAVNRLFWEKYQTAPKAATDYYYQLQRVSDYIKTRQVAKNIAFKYKDATYGELEITINLSKPEKTQAEIKAASQAKTTNYPKCALCLENEGYSGRIDHPARQNHRLIRLHLGDQAFAMQYSPYVYYNEHSIFLNEQHVPMRIDRTTFEHLFEIIDLFPHYFVGSNADLPGVGGSILSHDHYQGGRHTFPMERAEITRPVTFTGYEDVKVGYVNWPMTTLRLRGHDKERLITLADTILQTWHHYSDAAVDVLAETTAPHNTITPIARMHNDEYELDLVLRNNRTTEDLPGGIFHPHPEVQNIKQENIGLIEVMGLAILPPRLVPELESVKHYLLGEIPLQEVSAIHQDWAEKIQGAFTEDMDVDRFIQEQLGQTFVRILSDAGVFKQNKAGNQAKDRFVNAVNQTLKKA
ncbi:MAG: UDP-glucose--hexose-1-phosphate uridylyltransferase [Aerococcus sp.]|nr:UDP-glucose--hexose-1-phosphate uridylyltransferase [Aerococcus sp.]